LIAAFDLPSGPEKRGAKAKDWYQSFTALLLTVAENAGIRPTLYKLAKLRTNLGPAPARSRGFRNVPSEDEAFSKRRCAL